MKKAGVVITIFLALLALGVGFIGTTAALDITQPASHSTATIRFIVNPGDTTAVVAQHLQEDGLIRNAEVFKLYARFKHLDQGIEPGVYLLSPSMPMSAMLDDLQQGQPAEQLAGVPDGLRLTQYPPYFTNLPDFSATAFNTIAKTAVLPDGTKLWQKYWFVKQPQRNVFDGLEGYLYPDHYYFDNSDDATAVVEKMLEETGSQFCPGPTSDPTEYIDTLADCKSHPAMIGSTSIFTSMESAYHTNNDTQAIYDALTLASLAAREISNYSDAIGVISVYHNRYLYAIGASTNDGGTAGFLGSDPSAEYARDSDNPPSNGQWWAPLADAGKNIDPKSDYNTETHAGLPPGPIANPVWPEILAAAAPKSTSQWPYFYFVSNKCGKILYDSDYNDFNANAVQQENSNTGC
ncbi:MAG: endolytic transglycosylase MltG [Ktedonobacterales bacterium]